MPELLEQLKGLEPVCYLHLDRSGLRIWNFLAAALPLFNTSLLFRAAARPHFDYFLPQVDFLSLAPDAVLSLAEDEEFREALSKIALLPAERQNILRQIGGHAKQQGAAVTLITTQALAASAALPAAHTIKLRDPELFGNVEPVWRQLCQKLPAKTDIFYLALGPEKFLIGPRLKIKFRRPVIDVLTLKPSPAVFGLKRKAKALVRKLLSI